jgi:hypothetical protein
VPWQRCPCQAPGRRCNASSYMGSEDKGACPIGHVSLSACGWLYMFHAGVVAYLQDNWDPKNVRVYGTSAGAIVGCSLCCDFPTRRLGEEIVRAHHVKRAEHDFLLMVPLAERATDDLCPHDAHSRCTDRLTVCSARASCATLAPTCWGAGCTTACSQSHTVA